MINVFVLTIEKNIEVYSLLENFFKNVIEIRVEILIFINSFKDLEADAIFNFNYSIIVLVVFI